MLTNGTYLSNRYEILEMIGQGGMSHVYKAKDHVLGREVAVKVLKQEYAQDITFVTKFRAEAQSAAGLEHPNIVNIYDVGTENGMYYIVMEYVEGVTLKTYIERKERLNYKEVISIAIQVGRGIEAAHNKGIIHRDIKPQNIIISKEGKVKVTDFGIAKAVSSNTVHADMMGSVHYTSPEQARNGYVSFKSDIYSLGIVMYEMATGRVPFDGDSTVAIAIQHLQSEMVPPSEYAEDLPVSVEKIIQKATMKSPDRRYQTMEELLLDLRKALVTPDEDFVIIAPIADASDRTKIITEDELNEIKKEAGAVTVDEVELPENEDDAQEEELIYEEDDDDEDEGEVPKKVDKLITILGIVAAVVIVIIVLFIAGNILWGGSSKKTTDTDTDEPVVEETEKVKVTDVVGKTEEDATDLLESDGFTVKTKTASSDEYDKGEVMDQNPSAGKKVEKGSTITITVSSGTGDVDIVDVTGQTAEAAESTLKAKGFEVAKEYDYSNDVAEGVVISQDPAGKTTGKKGDTVTIKISQGSQSVKVPSVKGMTQDAANTALTEVGLSLGNVTSTYSDSVAEGNVISQSVTAGQYVDPGSTVDVVISKGKEQIKYSYSETVTNNNQVSVTYTLEDAEGETVTYKTVPAGQSVSLNAHDILTSSGTLSWESDDKTVTGSKAVTFTKQ